MSGVLLAVDIGNTQTTIGWFDGTRWAARWRIAADVHGLDELRQLLRGQIAAPGFDLTAVTAVSISSVVPAVTMLYADGAHAEFKVEPLIITVDRIRGFTVDYEPPSAIGPDRLCGIAAAAAKYDGPLIVIDFGTATVFDVLTAERVYRGGAIAPGLRTAMDVLHSKTALLPRADLEFPPSVIGRTTQSAMQSGVLFGTAAMVDGMVQRIRDTEVPGARVIATGGFAELIAPHCRSIQHVEPDLVLDGIRLITERQ